MAKSVLELIVETQQWDGGLKRAQAGLQNFISANKGLSNAIRNHQSTMAGAIAKFGEMGSNAKTASSRLNDMEKMFVELGMRYHEMTAQEKANPVGRATVKSMEQLKARILDTKTAMADLNKQMSISGGGGASFGRTIGQHILPGIGMGAGVAGAYAAIKAFQIVKDTVRDAVQANMEFEQSNANLAAVLGKTIGEIGALTENAKKLGATTIYTANQVTELQTVLARRGFGEEQILQMTHGITNLAVATGTNLADAAELAGSTMQAFGMKASQMDRITSVLGVSTTKSALTTQALGTALGYVAPAATAAGYSLEDTVSMLGVLVDSGLDASTAGTSLRQIIMAMSTENGKLARSFGRPVRGLNDFRAALEHVSNAEDLLSDASKEVRITAVPALISLANNKDRIMELRDSITDVGGELQKMADVQLNTLRGSATLLSSAWNGLMLSFSESNGVLKNVVDAMTALVSKMTQIRTLAKRDHGMIAMFEKGINSQEVTGRIAGIEMDGDAGLAVEKERNRVLTEERDKAMVLYDEMMRIEDLEDSAKHDTQMELWNKAFRKMFPDYKVGRDGQAPAFLAQYIAGYNDQIATSNAVLNAFDPEKKAPEVKPNTNPVAFDSSASKFKLGDWRDIPQAGTIADLEWQKGLVQNSMKLMSDPQDYADAKAHLAEIQAQIDAITGKNQPNEIKWEFGSLDHLNQILKDAKEHLSGLKIGSEEWEEALDDVKIASDAVAAAQKLMGGSVPEQGKDVKEISKDWGYVAQAVSSVGSAMQQIEDPGAKVAGIVATAVASTALGFAQAATADSKFGTLAWIAAAAAGLANMTAMVASIKSVTAEYHAEGGFIGGGPRGTDTVNTWLTPGELVLNRAQQNNLAGQLAGSANKPYNIVVTGKISGRDIRLAADTDNRSRGGSRGAYANIK